MRYSCYALALLLLTAGASRAEEPKPTQSPTPPEILEHVEADYPVDAREKGIEGVVVLLITVDDKGAVTDVKVKTPAGHGFDEAAAAAARKFRFKPARLGEKPVPVVVTYTYRFVLKTAPASQPASQPSSRPAARPSSRPVPQETKTGPRNLVGRVRERGTRKPLQMVEVGLPGAEGPGASTYTDADGRFTLRGVQPGKRALRFSKAGYRIAQVEAEVRRGEKTEVELFLERLAYNEYQITVRGKRPKQTVTRHVLKQLEIQRIPGTHGDTIKVIEVLPGVARTPMGLGGMIVLRGSDDQSSGVFVDSMRLPYLFHFGGLRSVISSDLIRRLDLYPGNPSAYYEDLSGGVIDVRTRRPKVDRLHAQLDLNIYEGGLLVEGPITDSLSFIAAFHRNWHDVVLGAVVNEDDFRFTVAPRYYDYQAKLRWQVSRSQSLELFWLGTDDKIELVMGKDEDVGFRFSEHTFFHLMSAKHKLRLSENIENTLTPNVLFYSEEGDFAAENHVDLLGVYFVLRDDLTWRVSDRYRFNVGLLGAVRHLDVDFTAPHFGRMGESGIDPAQGEQRSSVGTFNLLAGGAYAELVARPFDWLKVVPGARVDCHDYNGTCTPGGNLAARFTIAEGSVLKGAAGAYARMPLGPQISPDYGNPDLSLERSLQYSVGFERQITDHIGVDLTLFYTDMHDLVVTNPALNTDPDAPPYVNDGRGRAYGMELMIKHAPSKWFHGWLSYTLSRSERKFPGQDWEPFGLDQTHIFNLVGMARLPYNINVGLRFHLVSGNPVDLYTERGGVNADTGLYMPVSGTMKRDRLPLVHTLDLRVDKTFVFDRWLWTIYLDIKNVYDQRNPELLSWSYDYTQYKQVTGLPIMPAIGSRIEF